MDEKALYECLVYIDSYWNKIIFRPHKRKIGRRIISRVLLRTPITDKHIVEVPHACIVPNHEKFKYIFYWDTYFMFRGVLETKHEWIIPEMVDNFMYLFKKYHIIPNFNHIESLGRSQPPLLTSMIFDAYNYLGRNLNFQTKIKKLLLSKRTWLQKHIEIAKQEYYEVWQNAPLYNHFIPSYQLNRYGNRDVGYAQQSEQESGWDMTSRFYNRCNEFLPTDLNCFLYIYEQDFAKAANIEGNREEEQQWKQRATQRKQRMQIMWDEQKGFFYDYDYKHKTRSEFNSLAGFTPLWAGIATYEQAVKCVKMLPLFETPFGLTITDQTSLLSTFDQQELNQSWQYTIKNMLQPKQWDWPNIWPPLEYLTIIGLLKYGFVDDAKRIMEKSLTTHVHIFQKYKTLLEKMNGLNGDMSESFWYPTQTGFGWTNAIFYRYTKLLDALKTGALYGPRTNDFPLDLLISH